MIDDNNIVFICPKCHENFTLSELLQHDTVAFNSYVEARAKDELAIVLNKELTSFKHQSDLTMVQKLKTQEDEFRKQKEDIIEKHHQNLKQLETDLQIEKNNLKVLEETQEAAIAQKIAEIRFQLSQEINDLQLIIKDKTAIIDSQKQEITEKIAEIKSKDEIDYLTQKNEIEKEHHLLIAQKQKELDDVKNKLKLFESTKELEIDNKIKEAKTQVGQEITDLKLIIQAKELEMNQEIKDVIYQKENEYRDLKEQLEEKHQIEIAQLKEALEKNKVFSSKIKGENFEQEFARELQKGFGSWDGIEKITIGDTKADFLQIVKNNKLEIGKIVYEVKNAKWSDAWLPKFAVDVAKQKTKYGILVATSFNEKFPGISFIKSSEYDNIWISDPESFIFVAQVVRKLIEIENNFFEKEKQLSYTETSEIIKEYNQKILRLKEYLDFGLPDFLKSFRNQLSNLENVQNSLHRNANRLEKTREVLRKKFDKLVKNKLEEIVGQVIVESEGTNYIEEKIIDSPVSNDKSDNLTT